MSGREAGGDASGLGRQAVRPRRRVLYAPRIGKCCKGWGHAGCAAATLWRAAAPAPAQHFASAATTRPTGRPPRCGACAARSAARSLRRSTGASGTAPTRAERPMQKSIARAAARAAGAATARSNAACAARTLPSSGLPAGPCCSARRNAATTPCAARPARARAGRRPTRKNASTSMRAQGCGRRSTGPGTRRNEKGRKSGGRKRGRSAGGASSSFPLTPPCTQPPVAAHRACAAPPRPLPSPSTHPQHRARQSYNQEFNAWRDGKVGHMQGMRPRLCAAPPRRPPRLLQALHGQGRHGDCPED